MSDAGEAARIRDLLETEGEAVRENVTHLNDERYDAIERFDEYEEMRERARAVKEDAIERLPALVETVREAVEANGGSVYLADDAADANRYIEEVAGDAETLVKSKSMTTEELDVNDHLESRGVDVYETDLGEFVIQVADEAPSHLVGPSLHKSREDIARLFDAHFEREEPFETAQELTEFARDYLGERIDEADVGMTGANFVVADTGTLALVTNEGNARKCATVPDTHVAVAGVEKLLPTLSDLEPFAKLIARAATGQDVPQYLSLLTPPVDTPTIDFDEPDGPNFGSEGASDGREFHLVLVDNGRMAMREDDQLRETLYCIRCGACANSCANFQHVGGHAFGGETYTGGIATGWEAGVHGQDSAAEFNDLCTGCSRCVDNCPVKIDIPWINTVVRDRVNREGDPGQFEFLVDGLTPDDEPGGLDPGKRLFGNFETLAKWGSKTAPLSNRLAAVGPVRTLLEATVGVDARRDLPTFSRETFSDWFAARESKVSDPEREVALYADTYTNYVRPDRGTAAVRVLEALGVDVVVPDVPESGRAPLSQGMIATAERKAHETYDGLADHLDAGRDVVVLEPSDLAMFVREYEKFLDADDHRRLAEHSYEVLEYVDGLAERGVDLDPLPEPASGEERVAYHGHCQQRTIGAAEPTEALLTRLGYDVVTSDVECCGMAGSFGYKAEYYDLSVDVGEALVDEFASEADRRVLASGTSCLDQLDALRDDEATHPVELLDPGD